MKRKNDLLTPHGVIGTKEHAVNLLIHRFEEYLLDEKLVTIAELKTTREQWRITNHKIVAAIENFFMKPYQASVKGNTPEDKGIFREYLRDQMRGGRLLMFKLHQTVENPVIKDTLLKRAKMGVSELQMLEIEKRLIQIIKVLLA